MSKMLKQISTDKAPKAVGPYSQAIVTGSLVYLSGQIGLDPATSALADGVEDQLVQIMKNIDAVLTASGSDFDHVVKTTIYLIDMADYTKVNEMYATYFPKICPARSCVSVAALPRGAKIEVEVVAEVA